MKTVLDQMIIISRLKEEPVSWKLDIKFVYGPKGDVFEYTNHRPPHQKQIYNGLFLAGGDDFQLLAEP